jgi:electron transport complex protein RnfG
MSDRMSDLIASDSPPPEPAWPLYRALVGIALVCAVLIAGAFVSTAPLIERNRAQQLQRAVLQVLPGAVAFQPQPDAAGVYAGLGADGELVGFAIAASGMGYQDSIEILYGYDPRAQAVVGMQVLSSRETPGLGDRIENDPAFRANFAALDVQLAADGQTLLHPVALVKPGQKTAAWQVDGISGATISSRAIARMLDESARQWVPRLYPLAAQAQDKGGAHGG